MSRAIALFACALGVVACGGDTEPPPPAPAEWRAVFSGLDGALLRAWGPNPNDVYVVGADPDEQGPTILHFDGAAWKKLTAPSRGNLWWVNQVGPDDIRMVGDRATVLRYTPSTGAFQVIPTQTSTTITLFGVWGSSSNDVWYVGGNVARNRGVVLRDDGATVREIPLAASSSAAYFKVQGIGSDVWIVGQLGTAIRWDGTGFTQPPTDTGLPLMGVHGTRADRVFAVGGVSDGVLLFWDGSAWHHEEDRSTPQMFGVWAAGDDLVYGAGFNGRVYKRQGGAWAPLGEKIGTFNDIHAVWVDEAGGIWLAGGRLAQNPPRDGMLVRYGAPISSEVAP